MTDFFLYEDLSWPEVAALPRDLPLIIPLGGGYPIETLEQALSHPERAGLLPPIPFGWRSSGLAVPEPVLEDMHTVRALLGLKGDATEFSVVYGTVPQNSQEIPVETRSMLELMLELATGVDVPPADLTEGRALTSLAAPGETPPEPLLHIRCGKTAPSDAFAAVPYRNLWFWIDDTDRASKSRFTFLMILFSLAEGGQTSAAPLVTISAGK